MNDKIYPKALNLPSSKMTFIFSTITVIIFWSITILGLKDLALQYKAIICLLISSLVLFIDVVVLYVREREQHYNYCYLQDLLNKNTYDLEKNEEKLNDINKRLDDIHFSN